MSVATVLNLFRIDHYNAYSGLLRWAFPCSRTFAIEQENRITEIIEILMRDFVDCFVRRETLSYKK